MKHPQCLSVAYTMASMAIRSKSHCNDLIWTSQMTADLS